ncbi:hypothetical protein V1509DRAFT_613382 [Lipomyces kononenkoae]
MAESISIDPQTSDSGSRSTSSDHPELPPIIQDDPDAWAIFPWSKFPGFVKATLDHLHRGSCIGYDIESAKASNQKKWVCHRFFILKRQLSTATTDIDVEDQLEYWYNRRSGFRLNSVKPNGGSATQHSTQIAAMIRKEPKSARQYGNDEIANIGMMGGRSPYTREERVTQEEDAREQAHKSPQKIKSNSSSIGPSHAQLTFQDGDEKAKSREDWTRNMAEKRNYHRYARS